MRSKARLLGLGRDGVPDVVQLAAHDVVKALEQPRLHRQLARVDLVRLAELLAAQIACKRDEKKGIPLAQK